MSNLTDQVLGQLGPANIQQIAAQLGIDPAQAEVAIRQAVPMVVGGLAQQASTDAGASAVHAAAMNHAGLDLGSILGSVLGGGGGGVGSVLGGLLGGASRGGGIDPGAILGGIFGGRQDQATQGLGQASGLGAQNAGQLLAILAPIVMSVLGGMSRSKGLDPGSLGGALAQEQQEHQRVNPGGGLLGSLLDQDGDGQFGLGDLMKLGAGVLGGGRRV